MSSKTINIIAGCITLLSSGSALSACTLTNGTAGTLNVAFATDVLNPGSATAGMRQTRSLTSAQMASAMGTTNSLRLLNCTAGESLIWGQSSYPLLAGTSPGGTGYINIGIPNLYIYMVASGGTATYIRAPSATGTDYTRSVSTINSGNPRWSDIGNVAITLHKTGRVSQGGVVAGGTLARWATSDGKLLLTYALQPFTVQVLGCTVTTKNPVAVLGDVHRSQFKGPGSNAGTAQFDIGMDCDSAISPTITFSGDAALPDSKDVLALSDPTGSNTAKGVGVQILYKNNLVSLDSPVSLGTTTTQGNVSFPFTARYYQTDAVITGGDASATAQFTVNYE